MHQKWARGLAAAGLAALALTAGMAATLPAVAAAKPKPPKQVKLQLLTINDFHGALSTGRKLNNRPIGSAAVLAAYLDQRTEQAAAEGAQTLRLGGGDLIGASPPVSALLQDEPTIRALDLMDFTASVVGNHEFDEGLKELLRLQRGGCHPATGWFPGAEMKYLGANVVYSRNYKPALKPYIVRCVGGVRVGIIGVVLDQTPTIVAPSGVQGLSFLDEAATVNACVTKLRLRGVRSFVVLLHQGGGGKTDGSVAISGDVVPVVEAMDDDVDVVVSAHSHAGYKGVIDGKLVTQAYANGTALGDIDLVLDRGSGDVVSKTATIVDTYADLAGIVPDTAVAQLVADAEATVRPITEQVVATAAADIVKTQNAAGESPLGGLVADAQRWKGGTQVAFMNPGGIRADLYAGAVTWGALFTVQPFSNYLVTMKLTGAQIEQLLEQQWAGQPYARVLQVSGLSYKWNAAAAAGDRVSPADITVGGALLDVAATYTVTANSFLSDGGDNFSVFKSGLDKVTGPVDLDALIDYVKQLPQPFGAPAGGRIQLLP